MATWNDLYEQSPRNSNNPGFGAAAIRDVKTQIREILETSIAFGDGFVPIDFGDVPSGTMREGSARAYVLDDDWLSRPDIVPSPVGQIGQIKVWAKELTPSVQALYRKSNKEAQEAPADTVQKKMVQVVFRMNM